MILLLIFLILPIQIFTFKHSTCNVSVPITKTLLKFKSYSTENDDVDYSLMTRIDDDGKILNKKRSTYTMGTKSLGTLTEVDDFYQGKYKVVWTIRGVAQKLLFRNRDSNPPPLRTSPFKFAGLSGFVLKLWLDGLPNAPKGYMSMELDQIEFWGSLDPKICIFINDIIKGPFYYKSNKYNEARLAMCKIDDIDIKAPLKVGVMIAPSSMLDYKIKGGKDV